jgi:UDP-N-acetylmuramoyl-L-alanyl-D-glutamate--2,6-diaminopimelate ligase
VSARLSRLVAELGGELVPAGADVLEVRDVQVDSRLVGRGDLFAALPGTHDDGTRFAADALGRGAAAVLAPRKLEACGGVQWIHPDARRVSGEAAAIVQGRPARGFFVAAVTGTNGKTTTAHLVGQLLAWCGRRPAVLGTAGHRLADGALLPASHTTPDAPALQRLLARHRELGGDSVALEASSHALEQERLAGLEVSAAAFTNLTRDHLDYHGDMERYAAAKARLFAGLGPGRFAVVNADDPASQIMAAAARERGATVVSFGIRSRADLSASDVEVDSRGTRFSVAGMGLSRTRVSFPLAGRFNVENALTALAVVLVSGASPSHAVGGLAFVSPAPGRLQRIDTGALGFECYVDYAHTEDALAKALEVVREGLRAEARIRGDHGGRSICVFGCGGDRDRGKRAPMGRVAGRLAEIVVLTSDNPRGEDPLQILDEVQVGLEGCEAAVHVVPDRRAAIELALVLARPHDCVLIAGKGHETTQTARGVVEPFDDRVVAARALAGRAESRWGQGERVGGLDRTGRPEGAWR